MEKNEVTREMIEMCLDDDLDNMWEPFATGEIEISASEVIKKLRPNRYEDYFNQYCERNGIIKETEKNGVIHYIEIIED